MNKWNGIRMVRGAVLLAALLLTGKPLLAAQEVELSSVEAARVKNSVGLGLALLPDYEGSSTYRPVPAINARVNLDSRMYVSLVGTTLKANVAQSDTWNAGPLLRYRPARDSVHNSQVDRMKDIDAAFELGGFVSYNLSDWTFSASAAQDVAGGHGGFVFDLGAGYRYKLQQQTTLVVNATTTFASSDYMNTYFSVDFENALRSGLRMYSADGGWKDIGLGVALQHSFNRNWGIAGTVKYTRLLGDAADSPVVDDVGNPNQFLFGVLANYTF